MVVLAGALFIHSAWRAIRQRAHWTDSIALLIPVATYILVQVWMFIRWNDNGILGGRGNLDHFPLWSLISLLAHAAKVWDAPSLASFLYHLSLLAELGFIGGMMLLAALALSRSAIASEIKFAAGLLGAGGFFFEPNLGGRLGFHARLENPWSWVC